MSCTPRFLFVICQVGAETALKSEFARLWPAFRFAYSRPGFVSFKLPDSAELAEDFDPRSVFARAYAFWLGKIEGEDAVEMAKRVWELAGETEFDHLHVWQRDSAIPGQRGFEPGTTPLAAEVATVIAEQRPPSESRAGRLRVNAAARPGQRVLDCVLVDPGEWWVGFHAAGAMSSRWPGGVPKILPPDDVLSRAYLKTAEALRWSRLPMRRGQCCVEIGSSPGGSAQALLERGLLVIGIDPAEMDPLIFGHPNFAHIQSRGRDVKRRDLRDAQWLVVDSNVTPKQTLDTVEDIVTHTDVHVRGMLLTLKLPDWKLADEIPQYIERVRSWGYKHVKARQLAFNRREICVAALRHRSLRRFPAPSKKVSRKRTAETRSAETRSAEP